LYRGSDHIENINCNEDVTEIENLSAVCPKTPDVCPINARKDENIMPQKVDVDATDLKILDLLRGDSRLSFREIGKRINVSTGTVSERVKNMIGNGVIRRFTTAVDPDKLGLHVAMFLLIRVNPLNKIEDVVSDFEALPESCCIHYVTGDLDIIALVRGVDNEHASKVLENVRGIKGVERVESCMALKAYPQCGRCWCDCGAPKDGI
jgi:DNA-binding Lrp family transcriptional regulator